jgi:lipopolysaccharide transport system ATP-binding protein
VGIIGANGSGKSTLLRMLGGITRPTSGKAFIRGRVASVLDLGTGFHPDLSGLENIYLSGEMMGMKRAEIRAKVDEIIAFSELGNFMDTPVKHYSSGMFVRLAFSVIAHLDADILLMDEVISVGDAAFQVKSFTKNQELLTSGKTILLVSHNLNSLSRFTSRCLYLENGKLIGHGNTDEMIATYAESIFSVKTTGNQGEKNNQTHLKEWPDQDSAPGNEYIRLRKILVRNEDRTAGDEIYVDERIVIEVEFEKLDATEAISIALRINDLNGNPLFMVSPLLMEEGISCRDYLSTPGYKALRCIIQEHLFSSSVFVMDLFVIDINNTHQFFTIPYILSFSTAYKELYGNLALYKMTNHPILPVVNWEKMSDEGKI